MHGNGLSKRARGPGGRRVGPLLVAAAILAGAAGLPAADPGGAGPGEERMKVRDVIPDSRTRMPVLLLEDVKTGRRVLPLWIGVAEAKAILMALRNVEVPRPMTHDLMRNLIRDLKAKVVRIVVTDLREHTFIATVYLRSGGNLVQVDSRPSDAVALALRAKAPIFVSSRVLDQAGQIQPVEASPASELKAYGLTVQEITPELKPHFAEARVGSILITDVKQGSPAERDGLRRGDVVLHVNDLRVRGLKGFLRSLRTAGDRELPVRLSVSRGDRRLNLMLSRKKR